MLDGDVAQWDVEDAPEPVHRDVHTDIDWVVVYRRGFIDACDGRGPFRDAEAYRRGWGAGDYFRNRISATAQPLERYFPGWPVDPRNFPMALKIYSYRGLSVPIRMPKFSHGGDRRSEAFQSLA
jgi:hypothetical protein